MGEGRSRNDVASEGWLKSGCTSFTKFLAAFLRTSGPILGTREQYSPTSHRILALAIGTCNHTHTHTNTSTSLLN